MGQDSYAVTDADEDLLVQGVRSIKGLQKGPEVGCPPRVKRSARASVADTQRFGFQVVELSIL